MLITKYVLGMRSSKDVKTGKVHVYKKDMKRLIIHMMRLSADRGAGSQAGPKITRKTEKETSLAFIVIRGS